MGSNANDEVDKFKSHLQVYEGLLKDQAGEIASLKAEVAYLKKQLKTHEEQNTTATHAVQVARIECLLFYADQTFDLVSVCKCGPFTRHFARLDCWQHARPTRDR